MNYFVIDKPIQIINVINIIKTDDLLPNKNKIYIIKNFKNHNLFSDTVQKKNKYFIEKKIVDDFSKIKLDDSKINLFLPRTYSVNKKNKYYLSNNKIENIYLYDEGIGSYQNRIEIQNYIPHKKYKYLKIIVNVLRYFRFIFSLILVRLSLKYFFHFKYFYGLKKYKFNLKKFKGYYLYKPKSFMVKNPKSKFNIFKFKYNFIDILNENLQYFDCFEDENYSYIKTIIKNKILLILPDWYVNEHKVIEIIKRNKSSFDFIFFKPHTNDLLKYSTSYKLNKLISNIINSSLPAEIIINQFLKNNNKVVVYHDNSALYFNYNKRNNLNLKFYNYGYKNYFYNELESLFKIE